MTNYKPLGYWTANPRPANESDIMPYYLGGNGKPSTFHQSMASNPRGSTPMKSSSPIPSRVKAFRSSAPQAPMGKYPNMIPRNKPQASPKGREGWYMLEAGGPYEMNHGVTQPSGPLWSAQTNLSIKHGISSCAWISGGLIIALIILAICIYLKSKA
jgi:hypothetical protein